MSGLFKVNGFTPTPSLPRFAGEGTLTIGARANADVASPLPRAKRGWGRGSMTLSNNLVHRRKALRFLHADA